MRIGVPGKKGSCSFDGRPPGEDGHPILEDRLWSSAIASMKESASCMDTRDGRSVGRSIPTENLPP
jgi:hypothetical protein